MTSQEVESFQIRLSLKGTPPKLKSIQDKLKASTSKNPNNHVITIPPLMNMRELLEVAHERYGVPINNHKYRVELWNGFPPRKIDVCLESGAGLASLVTANGIRKNEALTVKIEKIAVIATTTSKANAKSKAKAKTKTSTSNAIKNNVKKSNKRPLPASTASVANDVISSSSPVTSARPQRASAKAASDSFKDVIRAQDKLIRQEKKSSQTSKSKSKSTSTQQTQTQTEAKKKAAEARAAAANARKLASLPGGRCLNGDSHGDAPPPTLSAAATTATTRKAPKPKSIFTGISTENDMSFALISSIDASSSGRNRKVSKVLRGAMRKTIEKSYEASRAVVRHSSIASGKVTFVKLDAGASLSAGNGASAGLSSTGYVNNATGSYTVRYPKGVEGIGFYEEQVHLITPLMLKAVVQAVYDDQDDDDDGGGGSGREMLKPQNMALLSPRVFWSLWFQYHKHEQCSSIEEALALLLPDLDWKFLHRRSRQLSDKAKDNLRQNNAKKETEVQVSVQNVEAGIQAVQAVELAMETMYDETVANNRERAAQAALSRFGNGNDNRNTGDKVDGWSPTTPNEVDEDELRECINECIDGMSEEMCVKCIHILINKLFINNWRILANSVSGTISNTLKEDGVEVNLDSIEAWISAAQIRSVEEIMLELLDGDQDLYEVLNDELSSATPKDLSLWAPVPGLLIEEAETDLEVTEDNVKKYCDRAKLAVQKIEWLQLYTTSIA